MRRVLRRVREDQGPDAVILSNRRIDDGIEVIAAIDYDEALMRQATGAEAGELIPPGAGIGRDTLLALAENDVPPTPAPAVELLSADLRRETGADREAGSSATRAAGVIEAQSLGDVRGELSSLRSLLETQLSGLVWKDGVERSPLRAQMLRNLARLGIGPDVAGIVVDRLEPVTNVKSLWHAPLTMLAQCLPVRRSELLENGGIFALIGPTGVGKTTTIAKLAAQYALANGADEIALVSADSYRIGAREHLMAFANIIGARVYSASNSAELSRLLAGLRAKKLVLIDTEGRSPRDRDLANRLAAFGRNRERVRFFLTLSAATQDAALDAAIEAFGKVPLEGCIVTKLDESATPGHVVSAMIRHDLPACWFCDGQQIPEDLYVAEQKKLWLMNRIVECLELAPPSIDERKMAQDYASASVANV